MRRYLGSLLLLITVIVIIIPALLVRGCTIGDTQRKMNQGSVINVFNHLENKVQKMEIEEYLKGVVAAEMPASFEMEALKAQAILARTYAIRRIRTGAAIPGHPEAAISTDAQTCQAWKSKDELENQWGLINYLSNWNKVSRAVEATAGQVLTYNGQLAEALYHSNAGGQTEDAAFVWGNSVPYLKSVSSPWDQEAPNFRREFGFTWQQLDQKLGTRLISTLQGQHGYTTATIVGPSGLVEILEMSPGKRILQIRVGGKVFIWRDLRDKLSLPTSRCEVSATPTGLKFVTYGNGHGVGMSQYGANGMAKRGATYHDIIHYYFPGALLGQIR